MVWLISALAAFVLLGVQKAGQVVSEIDDKTTFKAKFLAHAKNVDWKGIPVGLALAQADLESGSGSGSVFKQTNNLFSIKVGSGWKGHWNGRSYHDFRSYDSWEDSMRDWVDLMHFPLYRNALNYAVAGNIRGFAFEVKKVGYDASDPEYAQDLIERYNNLA